MDTYIPEKTQFGIDFLNIMRTLEVMAKDTNKTKNTIFADSAAKLFMVFWDFSITEIEESNRKFLQELNRNNLDKPSESITRISNFIKEDPYLIEMFVVQLSAMGLMDMDLTKNELMFVGMFRKILEISEDDFLFMCNKGENLALALNLFVKSNTV